jgi:hypothetical protein
MNLIDPTGTKVPELATAQSKLLLEAKTIMQGCGHDEYGDECEEDMLCANCSGKASQMLIDLTIFKEKLTHLFQNKECPDGDVVAMGLMISAVSPFAKYINSIIEEINSAIEILEGK